jgi:hypothetical protein
MPVTRLGRLDLNEASGAPGQFQPSGQTPTRDLGVLLIRGAGH